MQCSRCNATDNPYRKQTSASLGFTWYCPYRTVTYCHSALLPLAIIIILLLLLSIKYSYLSFSGRSLVHPHLDFYFLILIFISTIITSSSHS